MEKPKPLPAACVGCQIQGFDAVVAQKGRHITAASHCLGPRGSGKHSGSGWVWIVSLLPFWRALCTPK